MPLAQKLAGGVLSLDQIAEAINGLSVSVGVYNSGVTSGDFPDNGTLTRTFTFSKPLGAGNIKTFIAFLHNKYTSALCICYKDGSTSMLEGSYSYKLKTFNVDTTHIEISIANSGGYNWTPIRWVAYNG